MVIKPLQYYYTKSSPAVSYFSFQFMLVRAYCRCLNLLTLARGATAGQADAPERNRFRRPSSQVMPSGHKVAC